MTAKKITAITASVIVAVLVISWFAFEVKTQTQASGIKTEEAQKIVNKQLDGLAITKPLKKIAEKNNITVNSVSYGDEKDVILDCTVETVDIYNDVKSHYDEFMSVDIKKKNGTMFKSALDFKMDFEPVVCDIIDNTPKSKINATVYLYETKDGFSVYAEDKVINAVYGGIANTIKDIKNIEEYIGADGKKHKVTSENIKKGVIQCFEMRDIGEKPDTSGKIGKFVNKIKHDFNINFIEHARWKSIFKGLWVTVKLTFFALIIGILLGFLVAFVRCTYIKTAKHGFLLKLFNAIAQVYLTITRGTPAVVQIMIIYFVIFMPLGVDKFIAAVICFGLNSGAYVAEIVRGGIMSVDDGQIEAGRSLGFNYMQTMVIIVFPQAFKAVLPALANEFVVLLKETSVAFYIGLGDLMYAGNSIRSATYSPFMPLVSVALIYLVIVVVLSKLVGILERSLRNNER